MTEVLVFAVVEDDPPTRRLISALIASEGDVVVEAGSITQARTILTEYPWDVAIVDRGLPDGDGLDLCREISNVNIGTHRHVMIVSALAGHHAKMCGFEAGADDYIVKPVNVSELRAKLSTIRRSVGMKKALASRLAAMEQLSVIDSLTNLYNRRFFDMEMQRLFGVAIRHKRPIALLIGDIDHFKNINDTFGHVSGDVVLKEVSTAIASNVRSTDVLARYGGEEFAVILPETRIDAALAVADRIRKGVEKMRTPGDSMPDVTISLGVAAMPFPGISMPAQLIEAADAALYLAKSRGRNRVEPDAFASPRADLSDEKFGDTQVRL